MTEFTFINLLLVLLAAWTMGALAMRLGFPPLLGELIAGIVFGPAMLGWIQPDVGIHVLAEVGVFLMMLYIGMEINVSELKKSGLFAVIAAIGGFALPMAGVTLLVHNFGYSLMASLIAGSAAAVTSLAVGSRLLVDLKLMNTRLATVLTAGALLSDTLALVIFTGLTSAAGEGNIDTTLLLTMSAKIVAFFVGVVAFGLTVLPRLAPALQRLGFEGRTAHFTIVLLVALCYAELAELAGLHAILGAFLAGLFLGERFVGFRQSHDLREMVHDLSVGFLAPIFFVQSGFEVSFGALQSNLLLPVLLIIVAFAAKLAGTLLAYLPSGNGWREGTALGFGMNGRGALDLVIAGIALQSDLIDSTIFTSLVLLAIVSATIVPVLLKISIRGLRERGELVESQLRDGTVIIGASPTALEIGKVMAEFGPVHVVDNNQARCAAAREVGLESVQGNALEEYILQEAELGTAQTFLSLTPNPQINLFAAQQANEIFRVPNVFSQLSGEVRRRAIPLIENSTIQLFNLGAFDLTEWDRWLLQGKAEVERISVDKEIASELFVDRVHAQHPFLPAVILRNNEAHLFDYQVTLEAGDIVVGLALSEHRNDDDPFEELVRHADVIDIEGRMDYETCFERVAEAMAGNVDTTPALLAEKLIERERSDSTVLSQLLAVPHVLLPGQQKFAITIVRAREGIDMKTSGNGIDGDEEAIAVPALFITAGTKDMRNLHLRTLSAVAQLVQDPAFEQGWLDAHGASELRSFLMEIKRNTSGETFF